MFQFLPPGRNLPSVKGEIKSQYQTSGTEVISEQEGANLQDLCEVVSCASSRCLWVRWWYLSFKTDVGGNTAQEQAWVGPRIWMQPRQKTNCVYLPNPSPTAPVHIRTQEQTGAGMLTRRTPGEETCLFIPRPLWNVCGSIRGFERPKPCLEDNLGRTIWSRFPLFSLDFLFFPRKETKREEREKTLSCKKDVPDFNKVENWATFYLKWHLKCT